MVLRLVNSFRTTFSCMIVSPRRPDPSPLLDHGDSFLRQAPATMSVGPCIGRSRTHDHRDSLLIERFTSRLVHHQSLAAGEQPEANRAIFLLRRLADA